MKIPAKLVAVSLTFLAVVGCGEKQDSTDQVNPDIATDQSATLNGFETSLADLSPAVLAEIEQIASLYPDAKSTATGLHYITIENGSGQETPKTGDRVTAHYTGTLLNGTPFDSSIDKGRPFSFYVGRGRVIKGWDEAFLTMKKGEKRKLIIPSSLGYGYKAVGPIPSNSILVFDVELIDF